MLLGMSRPQADEFLQAVTPALNRGDVEALRDEVNRRWVPTDLCELLKHADLDVRRTAVVTLGLVGDRGIVGCLTRCLHDDDDQVHQFAEDALWSIWFRSGKCEAAAKFREAAVALTQDEYGRAIELFREASAIDPEFAEAHNQLAIAHYLANQWDCSMSASRAALALMPTHFGAMAGLGHCHAHRGELPQAIDCYRRALAINPRMHAIADAKARLETQLRETPPAADDGTVSPPVDTVLLEFDRDRADRE